MKLIDMKERVVFKICTNNTKFQFIIVYPTVIENVHINQAQLIKATFKKRKKKCSVLFSL